MLSKIDLKDKRILYALSVNCRQSNKQIAKKSALSEMTVSNRINSLQERGILEQYYVIINPHVLDYIHIKVYLRFYNIGQKQFEIIISELEEKKNVIWLCSLRGKYDLVVSILAHNIVEFTQKYDYLFRKWDHLILERNVLTLERAKIFNKMYLLPGQKREELPYGSDEDKLYQVTNFEDLMLKILSTKGRASYLEMAQKLNTSPETIKSHIHKLIKMGVITGFSTKIDFRKMGVSYYIIALKMINFNRDQYHKLLSFAKLNKNILYLIKCLGDHDIELEVEVTSDRDLDELLLGLRNIFAAEIKNYEILQVTREHSINYYPF